MRAIYRKQNRVSMGFGMTAEYQGDRMVRFEVPMADGDTMPSWLAFEPTAGEAGRLFSVAAPTPFDVGLLELRLIKTCSTPRANRSCRTKQNQASAACSCRAVAVSVGP